MSKVLLDVPYHSQLNNKFNPYGSCNVTCAAMAVKYIYRKNNEDNGWLEKFPSFRQNQLEDEMYNVMLGLDLKRHSPYDIDKLIELYGVDTDFEDFSTISCVEKSIKDGCPVIVHGWFTSFGHIILINGFDKKKKVFYVHDPYGKYWENGYDNNVSGENLEYSYDMIKRLCIESDRSFWVHHIRGLK